MHFVPASVLALALFAGEEAGTSEQEARTFFADYMAKSRASDPAEADLYCDEGNIEMLREEASGEVTRSIGSAPLLKRIVRDSAAEAKAAGDYSEFSRIEYQRAGETIKISAVRYSALRKYESPATFVVGMCENGSIGILEMVFYSKAARQ